MTNYVLIGDVHSQYSKFSAAVEWIQNNVENYHIIQGGDLFDSRTDESESVKVYELVKELNNNITVINSNHLYKMYRVLNNPTLQYSECLKRTFSDFEQSSISNQELIEWLETLPFGVSFKDNQEQEYRVCHAYWHSKLYVPNSYDGIYKIFTVSAKAKQKMIYGIKKKGEDERLLWWQYPHEHEFVRVAFHYHTISIDPEGINGNKHLVLDGSCGSDGGVLPVYVLNTKKLATF
jgi:hypothetical protein